MINILLMLGMDLTLMANLLFEDLKREIIPINNISSQKPLRHSLERHTLVHGKK